MERKCKWLYADWCHKPPTQEQVEIGDIHQEKCYWYCYGDVTQCPDYEETKSQ